MRKLVLVAMALLSLGYVADQAFYFLTNATYERLLASKHETRDDVERLLSGFRGKRVHQPSNVSDDLLQKLNRGWQYWRYAKYPGCPIDVVYDPTGRVYSLWPEYE